MSLEDQIRLDQVTQEETTVNYGTFILLPRKLQICLCSTKVNLSSRKYFPVLNVYPKLIHFSRSLCILVGEKCCLLYILVSVDLTNTCTKYYDVNAVPSTEAHCFCQKGERVMKGKLKHIA